MPLQRVQTIPEPPKTPELYLPSVYMHNMRSLNLKKFSELKLIAANYDIIAITESWLTAEKEQLYNLDNFTLHHCHRGKKRIGGGVAVYIRSHLNVKKLCSYSNQHVNLLVSLTSRWSTTCNIWSTIPSPWTLQTAERRNCKSHNKDDSLPPIQA